MRCCSATLTLLIVGDKSSHNLLSCSQHRHQFCENWQTLAMRYHRFPFCTSSLARFRDCSLLRLHILVLSHILPCERYACSYFRTISRLSPQSRTHFCFLRKTIYQFVPLLLLLNDEVYVLPFVPFEHNPAITILFILQSIHFLHPHLSFDLRWQTQNKDSTCFCGTCTINQFITKSRISAVIGHFPSALFHHKHQQLPSAHR